VTAPVRPTSVTDAGDLPNLPRILSPDEFEHAQLLPPSGLRQANFPVVPPPFAPRDQTRTPIDQQAAPKGVQLTGLPRILTQYVAAPIMDHPLTSVLTALIPGAGVVMGGLMGKDITEYLAQKTAEMSLSPEDRARAEADPERIPGERAAVEAAMLGAAPLVHAAVKGIRGAPPEPSMEIPAKVAPAPPVKVLTSDEMIAAAHADAAQGLPSS
jgi:hypothetical protein